MLKRFMAFRFYKNPALQVLLVVDGLVLMSSAMLTPIYAAFVAGVGGDLLDAGITAAALAFGSAIASIISGHIADKTRNKRQFIIVGNAVTGLGFLLFITTHNIWYLASVQVVIGLARAFAEPAFDALYSVHLDKHKEAEGWAAWEAVAYFTAGVGALVGGAIVSLASFNVLFVVMASLCGISAIYMSLLPRKAI